MKLTVIFLLPLIIALASCMTDEEGKKIDFQTEIAKNETGETENSDSKDELHILPPSDFEESYAVVYVTGDGGKTTLQELLKKGKGSGKTYSISIKNSTTKKLAIKFKAGIIPLMELTLEPKETQTIEGVVVDFISKLNVEIKEK